MIEDFKSEIKSLDYQPLSAWICGKAAQGTDDYGDPVQIALLGELKWVDTMVNQLKKKLIQKTFEARFDITIDLRGVTKAEIETRPFHIWIVRFNMSNPVIRKSLWNGGKSLKEAHTKG